MSVLMINSSARFTGSNSRVLTRYLTECLDEPVINRDLALSDFSVLNGEDLMDIHNSKDSPRDSFQWHKKLESELVSEVKKANTLVFGVPIYNFTIPTVLNQWVNYVVKPGVTFKYGDNGPEGLSDVKRAFIVTSSGGTDVGGEMDFASPYMDHICRFIGVDKIHHIDASGSKGSAEKIIEHGKKQINQLLEIV